MNATILHESHGRIRIKLKQKRMTLEQAESVGGLAAEPGVGTPGYGSRADLLCDYLL